MERWTDYILIGSFTTLGLAFLLAFVRLVLGPSLADRVVALDLMAYVFLAFVGVLVVSTGNTGMLNVALALGLMIFMGTMAFARYIERVHSEEEET